MLKQSMGYEMLRNTIFYKYQNNNYMFICNRE